MLPPNPIAAPPEPIQNPQTEVPPRVIYHDYGNGLEIAKGPQSKDIRYFRLNNPQFRLAAEMNGRN